MYIGVYAYGESRFDLTFNPCNANIDSLCPTNASIPISADGIIPVSASDVASVVGIALTIPDFEGIAILRIFANSTESEIGCFSAVLTNGATFSQPVSVGTVLGVFTVIALVASFATAIYGDSIPIMRTHYAHSISVFVVFAVWQHIFYLGALSMNWPSVLVAWWSNFAWTGGMIYSSTMQSSINKLIGNNVGNTSEVGAAASGSTQESLGGGYDISAIYKRSVSHVFKRDIASDIYQRSSSFMSKSDLLGRGLEQHLQRRSNANASTGYTWYGHPVGPGLPLPGNYSGFAGTLAEEGIRTSNAFMTGFLWFLILIVILVGALVIFKWVVEGLVAIKILRSDRLSFFRKRWLGYSGQLALRTCYIGFFMMMFLTMFEFSYQSSGGVKAIAAIVFIFFLFGIPACVGYAYIYRVHHVNGERTIRQADADEHKSKLAKLTAPLVSIVPHKKGDGNTRGTSVPLWTALRSNEREDNIHEDEDYVIKFGWLAARFRRTRWWFFGVWTFYEFLRACFFAGASGHPLTQVFGLLVVETLAFAGIIWARPFEGTRLNLLVVYLLGFSKVVTVALSAAFDVSYNLPRITTTVIGIVIIVIQGVLAIVTLIAIAVGAISSYMSLTRNRNTEDFRPRNMQGIREKYFVHIDRAATDLPRPPTPPPPPPEEPKGPYFNVSSVRRLAKIEDEDPEFATEMSPMSPQDPSASYRSLSGKSAMPNIDEAVSASNTPSRRSRAVSMNSQRGSGLPFGARPHRKSWSQRDFYDYQEDRIASPINMSRQLPGEEEEMTPVKPASRSLTLPNPRLRPAPSAESLKGGQKLRAAPSLESLKVGGDASNHENIGSVPAPVARPRSGTWGPSRPTSRNGTPTHSMYQAEPRSLDMPQERRNRTPLAPTLEIDEAISRMSSRNQ